MRHILTTSGSSLWLLLAPLTACSDDAPQPTPPSALFESDDPSGMYNAARDMAAPDAGEAEDDPSRRQIEEADIFKLSEDRLYALSRYGGLSVIDVEADAPRLLGRKQIGAMPLEMYVRANTAFVLYNDYGQYEETDDEWYWTQNARLLAFDTSDPANIATTAQFDLPGTISDSRLVGDILYVVSFESGDCWQCSDGPRTTVVSIDVSEPGDPRRVDELQFDESKATYSWLRSVSATDQRLYVAGPTYGEEGPIGSTISIIDISAGDGELSEGPEVQVAGQVASRWQMDEYQGVLRVLSQPGDTFDTLAAPSVQTFRVSATALEPLGHTDLVIPRGETLRSVRFDAERGYAITALQTDPLFTIDLSDPEAPAQLGELVMPGWVFHMEPFGDRVLGLGFDQGNPAGALAVSLFDVSDLREPTELARVNFGGDWAWLAEDQDRIHKAFNVLQDINLILMPFSGWSSEAIEWCGGSYVSGVQLIDWQDDNLALRGVAPSLGQARRGFLHEDKLFTLSDERLDSFDIEDRDDPQSTGGLPLAQMVTRSVPLGEHIVRVSQNWWTNAVQLDVTTLQAAENPLPVATLELPEPPSDGCYGSSWLRDIVPLDSRLAVIFTRYDYDPESGRDRSTTRIATVDLSDPTDPQFEADAELPFAESWGYGGYSGLVEHGASLVSVGAALVFISSEFDGQAPSEPTGTGKSDALETSDLPQHVDGSERSVVVRVVDLEDPAEPEARTIVIGQALANSGLFVDGSTVALSHVVRSASDPSQLRFFLDRLDLSDPTAPSLEAPVNIPGSLVAFDADQGRLFSVSYREVQNDDLTASECYETYANARFEPENGVWNAHVPGTCVAILQSLNLVRFDSDEAELLYHVEFENDESVSALAYGDDRLFLLLGRGYGYRYGIEVDAALGPTEWYPLGERDMPLLVASGFATGDLRWGRLSLPSGESWGSVPLIAVEQRAAIWSGWRGQLHVVDAEDAASPRLLGKAELNGNVWQLSSAAGNRVLAALGYDGLQVIDLDDFDADGTVRGGPQPQP